MKKIYTTIKLAAIVLLGLAASLSSCKEEEELPITNDLRVLQVKVGADAVADGITDLSVLTEIELVFSHGLDASAFESALVVSPAVAYSINYDETGSFVTISPDTRLEYETSYSVALPSGTYGKGGEKSVQDFSFDFTTKAFAPPKITLSSDVASFFEGEVATVTAKLDNIIFDAVTFDLVFSGTATGPGADYTTSATSISIPAGSSEATFTITSLEGDDIEGTESIIISLANVVNGSNDPPQQLTISLGDKAPSMELKGVMELDDFDASGGQIRAVHINVLKDIPDLSIFHIQIASNGAAPDPLDIDFVFPAQAATAGDQLFVVRDADATLAATYFGANYSSFTEFQAAGMTQNGDDAVLLYENGVAIESFGEPGVDGTGLFWEYTNSWAYKLGEEWYYPGVGCTEAADATDETSTCRYPEFSPGLEFRGIMDLNHNGGTNLRAYHLFALQDIPDLSLFGAGIASNGQATSDGVEIPLPSIVVKAGEHILVIRDLDVSNAQTYFESCYDKFDHVIPDGGVSSNGDDTIELFKNEILIETYGVLGVDGTGQPWEYDNSWAYKVAGAWTYGGVGCSTAATTNATSSCPYTFCN
ncbi:MAG: Ig-like domain-containing protein [Cyclobacteriaceae bacterium]